MKNYLLFHNLSDGYHLFSYIFLLNLITDNIAQEAPSSAPVTDSLAKQDPFLRGIRFLPRTEAQTQLLWVFLQLSGSLPTEAVSNSNTLIFPSTTETIRYIGYFRVNELMISKFPAYIY